MGSMRIVSAAEVGEWNRQLTRCGRFDVYHLAEYHHVAFQQGEGEPFLLVFEHAGAVAALPLLRRPVHRVPGLEATRHYDATTVYGYPGLLCSSSAGADAASEFRKAFQESLPEALHSLGIVSLFARQHPLIDTSWLWDATELCPLGPTVVIDLARPENEQWRAIRNNHRRDIRRAARMGLTVEEDPMMCRLEAFRRIYEATMQAVGAQSAYFFPQSYYQQLRERLGNRVKLFFARYEGKTVAAALFFQCGDIIQYHLGGSAPAARRDLPGPIKSIFDAVRRWGKAHGFRWFHLGGGLGARRDSLFSFKAGFSPMEHTFHVVRKIVQPDVYQELVARRAAVDNWQQTTEDDTFFPAYRRPSPQKRVA